MHRDGIRQSRADTPAPHSAPRTTPRTRPCTTLRTPHHTPHSAPAPLVKPTFFKASNALRAWFTRHGATKTELWIGYYKKASGKGGVVYQQALDEALCVGWIDGVLKSIDDTRYMQRWTPRKPTSIWSKVNIRKVQALIAAGRMMPAGLAAFARRTPERSGVYSFENDPRQFSPEFATRFRKERRAWAFFESQPPYYRRTVTAYVMSARRPDTRERRLAHVIAHAARGERIPQFTPAPRAMAQPTRRAPPASARQRVRRR